MWPVAEMVPQTTQESSPAPTPSRWHWRLVATEVSSISLIQAPTWSPQKRCVCRSLHKQLVCCLIKQRCLVRFWKPVCCCLSDTLDLLIKQAPVLSFPTHHFWVRRAERSLDIQSWQVLVLRAVTRIGVSSWTVHLLESPCLLPWIAIRPLA